MLRSAGWAVTLSLILSTASAASAEGLVVSGTVLIENSGGEAPVVAAFGEPGPELALACPALLVTSYEWRAVVIGATEIVVKNASRSYVVHDAKLRALDVAAAAWVGIYPSAAASARTPSGATRLDTAHSPMLGNAPSSPERVPEHDRPSFSIALDGYFLALSAASVLFSGISATKMSGVRAELESRENTSVLDTRAVATTPNERVRRWAVLECEGDEATLTGLKSGEVMTRRWETPAARSLHAGVLSGNVLLEEDSIAIGGQQFDVTGSFGAVVSAEQAVAPDTIVLALRGDARSAAFASAPAPSAKTFAPFFLIGAVVLGVAAGAGATVVITRRRAKSFTLDEYVDLMNQAAAEGHHVLAAKWASRALESAPDHPRLLTDYAYFLAESGDVEEAIKHYRRALDRSPDAEAELAFARLQASFPDAKEEVVDLLRRALEKEPVALLEIMDDELLSPFLADPRLAHARVAAQRALDLS